LHCGQRETKRYYAPIGFAHFLAVFLSASIVNPGPAHVPAHGVFLAANIAKLPGLLRKPRASIDPLPL
jgi:hypothetical protein